jgi:hypothetical protein
MGGTAPDPAREVRAVRAGTGQARTASTTISNGGEPRDPFIAALARYVEALHRRYPESPAQMRREALDGRANITAMHPPTKDTAA